MNFNRIVAAGKVVAGHRTHLKVFCATYIRYSLRHYNRGADIWVTQSYPEQIRIWDSGRGGEMVYPPGTFPALVDYEGDST